MKLTLLKWGLGSPSGFPKLQSSIAGGQKTSHWGVLYIIGKLSKCRCRKWARMSHLDICSTSYGQKKGRESNYQFNSRPRKVENQPNPTPMRVGGVQHTAEKFSTRATTVLQTCPNWKFKQKVIVPQSCKSPNHGSFKTPPWESQDKKPLGCGCRGEA